MNLPQQLEIAKQLSEVWTAFIGEHLPSQRQFLIWLTLYEVPIIEKGIERAAVWFSKGNKSRDYTDDDLIRYASGVMASAKREATPPPRGFKMARPVVCPANAASTPPNHKIENNACVWCGQTFKAVSRG